MEPEGASKSKHTSHLGHAVRRLRVDKRLSQAQLGNLIGMSQEAVSRYENKVRIEDEVLKQFAKGLDVSVDLIKELEEDKPLVFYIENNTFSGNDTTIAAEYKPGEITNNYIDKAFYDSLLQMQKLYENSIRLYDQLLQSTQEKIASLEKQIAQQKN